MAGIGFEIRKIFSKKTLASSTFGVIYATMATIGPSLIFLVLLFSLKAIIKYYHVSELENLFFSFSFTYLFLFAILTSSFQNNVLSRYVSDKIFEKKEGDICSSMFGMLTVNTVISAVEITILCVLMYQKNQLPFSFLVAYYLLGILASNAYNLMVYISALKEYKKVTYSYAIGIIMVFPILYVLYQGFHLHLIFAIYWALVIGFIVINIALVCCCVKAFGLPNGKYFEFLTYFRKHPKLIISGFSYMLGFYACNIIYGFFSDMKTVVSIFHIAPNYDLAMFLAILINLSSVVVFEVKTETTFYDRYVSYLSAINGGTYDLIEKERVSLQNVINLQTFFVYEVQLIISIILICLVNVFYPYFGINPQVLNMFLLLGMGVYCTMCMYFTVVFLYYFDDYTSACIGPCVFLGITVVGAFLCCKLGSPFYPLPLLVGAIVGWIISFILLRRRLKNLNAYILC